MTEATGKKHGHNANRRNMWLLLATTLIMVVSAALFMPPQEKINQGLDIQGGLSVVLTANSTTGEEITGEDMEASRSIIERRVNALGASEATVHIQGNNQILVQIPGLSNTQTALDTIGEHGQLEFARLDSFTDETAKRQIQSGQIHQNSIVTDEFGNALPAEHPTNLHVDPGTYTPIITGANIKRVYVDRENGTGPDYAVNIELDSAGADAFAQASRDLVADHGQIVIILDGEVNSAPAVQSEITDGKVQITGGYTQDAAKALKIVLESGSLPVSFTYSQSETVGPTLGQDALATGVMVALAGLVIVMIYLFFFYKGLGLITAAAIAVFAVFYLGLLALLSHFGLFSLSLAGVAGIVLTIGMAADSSVLTLERFREEIRFGRSVRAASITGVRHGILTSIDADLVSLVTALSLFFLASSGVKGFGLTLALGICCDVETMSCWKAPIIRLLAPKQIAKNPEFWGVRDSQVAADVYKKLAELEGEKVETAVSAEAINSADNQAYATRKGGEDGTAAARAAAAVKGRFIKHDIPFLAYRKVFLSAAAIMVVFCVAIIGIRGLNLGIEFIGGTSITFNDTSAVTTDQMRDAFNEAGEADPVIQTTSSNGSDGFIVRITNDDAASAAAIASQVANTLGISTDSFQVSTIGPGWGDSIINAMVIALLVSFVLIVVYIGLRFEYKMGVTAIVALLHDLILVVGIYALIGREINPNVVAALLTILGYSLYDTVVVFHRISDNMEHSQIRCTFMTMANHSMNQVFIRSINTTLTSIFPVLAMLLFGSETLQDFAFAMTIGLVVGAYSSIAIACPLFAIWKTREPKNQKLTKKYGTEVGRFAFEHGALLNKNEHKAVVEVPSEVQADAAVSVVAAPVAPAPAEPASIAPAPIAQPKQHHTKKQAKQKQATRKQAYVPESDSPEPGIRIIDRKKFEEAARGAAGKPDDE